MKQIPHMEILSFRAEDREKREKKNKDENEPKCLSNKYVAQLKCCFMVSVFRWGIINI